MNKITHWWARNQDNVPEWSDMSTRGMLFYRASTISRVYRHNQRMQKRSLSTAS
jgi:hypothetical protein